jgi:hypothetical protein
MVMLITSEFPTKNSILSWPVREQYHSDRNGTVVGSVLGVLGKSGAYPFFLGCHLNALVQITNRVVGQFGKLPTLSGWSQNGLNQRGGSARQTGFHSESEAIPDLPKS